METASDVLVEKGAEMAESGVEVEVFKRKDKLFDWRVVNVGNHTTLGGSQQGFTERNDAREAWERLCRACGVREDVLPVFVVDEKGRRPLAEIEAVAEAVAVAAEDVADIGEVLG